VEKAAFRSSAREFGLGETYRDQSMKHLLALLIFMSFYQAKAAPPPDISDADEVHAGQILAAQFIKEQGLADTPQTLKIEQYLQTVGDKVTAHAKRKLPYRFHFDPDPTFRSAVGLPGGEVFVGGGILAYLDTEDQLAAVLGHEVEHIDLNQCRDRLRKIVAEKHLTSSQFDQLKVDDFLPGYGHDNERAADFEGTKLAMEAGYSPAAAVRLLRTFIVLGQQMPNTSLEAQKSLEERIELLQPLLKSSKEVKERPLKLLPNLP
jgi:predicted Zn-dependent protease